MVHGPNGGHRSCRETAARRGALPGPNPGCAELSGIGKIHGRAGAPAPFAFDNPGVQGITFLRQGRPSPLDEGELVFEVGGEAVDASRDSASGVGRTEHQVAQMMEEDGSSTHDAGLKGCEQGHFSGAPPKMGWDVAQDFDFCMAREVKGGAPDRVHPSGDDFPVQRDDSGNREIAAFVRFLRETDGLAQEGLMLGGERVVHGYRCSGGRCPKASQFEKPTQRFGGPDRLGNDLV